MELIIIKTSDSQNIRNLLEEKNINYEIYQEPMSIFASYGETLKDKEREEEAKKLENSEEEDIINEEW